MILDLKKNYNCIVCNEKMKARSYEDSRMKRFICQDLNHMFFLRFDLELEQISKWSLSNKGLSLDYYLSEKESMITYNKKYYDFKLFINIEEILNFNQLMDYIKRLERLECFT
jgi:hypothetical protein